MEFIQNFLMSLGPFFLLLGLLIFVHELGHFLVAVWCGVRVETFSLGFGKKILSYKKGHTTYCVSLIPLGGYVKMFGDDPNNPPPPEDRSQSFLHQPVLPRIAIVLAGPLMNLFFAILLFAHIGYWGEPVPGSQIGDVDTASAAAKAGFASGDKILAVDGVAVNTWKDVRERIEPATGREIKFDVEREDGSKATVSATPELRQNPNIFSTDRSVGSIDGLQLESRASLVSVIDVTKSNGINNLDLILSINGKKIEYWRHLEPALSAAIATKAPITLEVQTVLNDKDKPRTIVIDPKNIAPGKTALEKLSLESSELSVFNAKKRSPAEKAGLKAGDRIVAINGNTLTKWEDLLNSVKNFDESTGTLKFLVRRGPETLNLSITPEVTEIPNTRGNFDKRFAIGISPALYTAPNPSFLYKAGSIPSSILHGINTSIEWTKLIAVSFVRLIGGEVSAKNIGGVISIGKVANQSYDMGWVAFLKMMAILSINLFILNLLPVPVLDGGHLVFFTIEAIKGSPLSLKKMEFAQQVGLVLLLCLMAFALFNDITNVIATW